MNLKKGIIQTLISSGSARINISLVQRMSMHTIPLQNLLFMLLPVAIVGYFYYKWLGDAKEIAYATLRMTSQLLLIGYVLEFLFKDDSPIIGVAILLFMIAVSSMIALRSCKQKSFQKYNHIFASIAIGGSFNLLIVFIAVLDLKSLYAPMVMIPLAGMIYANAMNAVAIAVERFNYEVQVNDYVQSRFLAFKAADPSSQYSLSGRSCFSSRDDDRADTLRCQSSYCSTISDSGDGHGARKFGDIDYFVFILAERSYQQDCGYYIPLIILNLKASNSSIGNGFEK